MAVIEKTVLRYEYDNIVVETPVYEVELILSLEEAQHVHNVLSHEGSGGFSRARLNNPYVYDVIRGLKKALQTA